MAPRVGGVRGRSGGRGIRSREEFFPRGRFTEAALRSVRGGRLGCGSRGRGGRSRWGEDEQLDLGTGAPEEYGEVRKELESEEDEQEDVEADGRARSDAVVVL